MSLKMMLNVVVNIIGPGWDCHQCARKIVISAGSGVTVGTGEVAWEVD